MTKNRYLYSIKQKIEINTSFIPFSFSGSVRIKSIKNYKTVTCNSNL